MRSEQSLRDERKAHRKPGGQTGPGKRGPGPLKFVLALLSNGFVNDVSRHGDTFFRFVLLFFGKVWLDESFLFGQGALGVSWSLLGRKCSHSPITPALTRRLLRGTIRRAT